jgi:hypothetical protein
MMQKSGHFHTISDSTTGKVQFVPIGNRVNHRASLDGAEKRKISAYASTRTHNHCHPAWDLDNASSEQAYIDQVVRKRIKRISSLLFYYT